MLISTAIVRELLEFAADYRARQAGRKGRIGRLHSAKKSAACVSYAWRLQLLAGLRCYRVGDCNFWPGLPKYRLERLPWNIGNEAAGQEKV